MDAHLSPHQTTRGHPQTTTRKVLKISRENIRGMKFVAFFAFLTYTGYFDLKMIRLLGAKNFVSWMIWSIELDANERARSLNPKKDLTSSFLPKSMFDAQTSNQHDLIYLLDTHNLKILFTIFGHLGRTQFQLEYQGKPIAVNHFSRVRSFLI